MVMGAKSKTNESFGSQPARVIFRSLCQCGGTHARLFDVEREEIGNQSTRNKQNKHNVTWATVHVQL